MNIVTVEYNASVMVDAGWRSVTIKANGELSKSGKMVRITEVLTIDGCEPLGYTSRTGAKRQRYNASAIKERETGKNKRLSTCSKLS